MKMFTRAKKQIAAGFTLIEVVVVMPIVIIVIGSIIVLLVGIAGNSLRADSQLEAVSDTQRAFQLMEEDSQLTTRFISTTDKADGNLYDNTTNDPYGSGTTLFPSGYTDWDTDPNKVLILRTTATSDLAGNSPVYVREFGCNTSNIMNNPTVKNNIVYFVANGSLYRRVLTDSIRNVVTIGVGQGSPNSAAPNICSQPAQRESCPASVQTGRSALCKADDTLVANNVTAWTTTFYNGPYQQIGPDSNTTAAKVSITITKTVAGEDITFTNTLQINRRDIQ